MKKLLLAFLVFFLFSFCGSAEQERETDLAAIYTRAVGDFIQATNRQHQSNFDTLFIGKRAYGQPDDFPDIQLPKTILNTHIVLVSPELGKTLQNEHKKRVYINLFAWVEKEKAEFLFVTFSNGFEHQYDYTFNYQYNKTKKVFVLNKTEFKGPPFK